VAEQLATQRAVVNVQPIQHLVRGTNTMHPRQDVLIFASIQRNERGIIR
jgi:hypothetical protein